MWYCVRREGIDVMEINCVLCGESVKVADVIAPGQHVRCPFCGGKFSYAIAPNSDDENDRCAPTGGKLLIRCVCCGEQIEVDAATAIGQHVRCPCCGKKFSYGIENTSKHDKGGVGRKKMAMSMKCTKGMLQEARSKMDGRAEVLAKRKTVVGMTIACSAVIVIALLSSFAYLNWHEEKASEDSRMAAEKTRRKAVVADRNQRRGKLSQYISGQLKDLRRKKSDVVFEINGVSRMMRDKRDAGEDVCSLKRQKEVLRIKQDAIQDALNVFLDADMRIDAMDSAEIENAERELAQKMRDLVLALEMAVKQDTQKVSGEIKVQAMPKTLVSSAVRHDIEMQNRKQSTVESQEAIAGEPKGDQSIMPLDDCSEATVSNGATIAAEVKVGENEKPKVVEKPQLRKCHRCFGKGMVVETVNEKCDDCDGRGYIVKEVVLKDTKHHTDGYWNYKRIGTRVSKSRQNCSRCNHRGKIAVKREKKCPTCKGCGFFAKGGIPYEISAEATGGEADEISQWLIPTAEHGGTVWHYIKAEPERSWFKVDYDHSKWFDGASAFSGNTDSLTTGTGWDSHDIYLRKKFKFDGNPARIKVAKLRYTIDDILHVWLNESKIAELSGVDERYREIDVTREFGHCLRHGENVIAVWAHDVCGRRNVDVGLFVTYERDE